jgi:hypothetical protein
LPFDAGGWFPREVVLVDNLALARLDLARLHLFGLDVAGLDVAGLDVAGLGNVYALTLAA